MDNFLLNYRNARHSTTHEAPAQLLKGRILRHPPHDSVEVTFWRSNENRVASGIILGRLGHNMYHVLDVYDGSTHRRHRDQLRLMHNTGVPSENSGVPSENTGDSSENTGDSSDATTTSYSPIFLERLQNGSGVRGARNLIRQDRWRGDTDDRRDGHSHNRGTQVRRSLGELGERRLVEQPTINREKFEPGIRRDSSASSHPPNSGSTSTIETVARVRRPPGYLDDYLCGLLMVTF